MIFQSLFFSLVLTLIIEVPIAVGRKIPLNLVVAANVITNPVVVLLFHWARCFALPLVWVTLVLEVLAVVVEGYLYKDTIPKSWRFSLFVNGVSFTIGLLLEHLLY